MGVNFSAINLKVTETGLTELEKRLDKLDQKAEKIRDQLLGTFKEGVTKPAGEAAKAVDEIGHHSELMSHSAMIGLGELSRGLAKVGSSGEAGAFAMKEFAGAAMRLGASLGEAGGLAGIAVLVGGALYEMFSKARKEMKETEEQFKTSIANMANEGRAQDLVQQAREAYFGTPYDDKGNLRNPSAVQGAFQGSLADLRSRMANMKGQLLQGGILTNDIANQGIFKAMRDLQPQLDAAEKKFREINTALDVMKSRPADMSILPMKSTAAKPLTPEQIEKNERELNKLIDFANGVGTQLTLQAMGAKITGGLGVGGAGPLIGGIDRILGKKGPQAADIVLTPSQKAEDETIKNWKKLGEKIGTEMASTLANSLSKGFESLFAKGGSLKSGFKAMTGTLIEGLGTMFEQVGEKALVGLQFMQRIIDAISTMNPAFGIGAAIGLIALGAAMKGAGASMSSAGSGGGGGSYASTAPASTFGTVYVNPAGPPASPSAAGITPRSSVVLNATIVGKDDPQAQRQLLEMIARAQRRGSVSG